MMSSARNIVVWFGRSLALVCGLLMLAGCESLQTDGAADKGSPDKSGATNWITIRKSEQLTIELRDITPEQKIEQTVQEDGSIGLTFNMKAIAEGKTVVQLRQEIHDMYVPKYYRRISVNIKRENLFFFVGGEVKTPGRLIYTGDITVTKAIQAAGDFTVYADKKNIKVIRANGKIEKVNYKNAIKEPKKDLPIYPGDQIIVPLSPY
jgi:polysaccharide biosynthesis/export protein VpsN